MTDKNKQENFELDIPQTGNGKLSDDLKKRISTKLPEGIDISSIGNIDLHEAEKIANEEIVFLTEDDLIEGLEDFELIPLKNGTSSEGKDDKKRDDLSELRIKDISEAVNTEEVFIKTDNDNNNEVLFENFNDDVPDEEPVFEIDDEIDKKIEAESADEVKFREIIEEEPVFIETDNDNEALFENFNNEMLDKEITLDIDDEIDKKVEAESADEVKFREIIEEEPVFIEPDESEIRDVKPFEQEVFTDIETDTLNDDSISFQLEDLPDESIINNETEKTELVEKPAAIITENSINIQFEEIFTAVTAEKENVPMRFGYKDDVYNNTFIDDVQVHKTEKDTIKTYQEDPLTNRLARIIHVSDSPMSVITEKTDYYNDHAYILEDTTLYDKSAVSVADKDEIFYSDPELDYIENAIVKNDFSSFIQEIDDYYDVSKIAIESQITEILGLNLEEHEVIDKSLFSEYYSTIDVESEIDFLNPDLDFIHKSYAENKSVSYFLDNPDSLFENEKNSIEDDITSDTAIVFEEDVDDLKFLIERDYGYNVSEEVESDNLLEASGKDIEADIEISYSSESDDLTLDLQNIINITDQVVILEDRNNVEAFTNQFPEKKEDLVKLLSYLDGLFEKLPEEAVKKFAQSEYFDLYVKVMNEIGA